MTEQPEKLIIIGAGPAGYTAALYAARAGLNPLLIRGPQPGGQLTITTDVENYPGFPTILGPDLMEKMAEQTLQAGTRFMEDTIQSVDFSQPKLRLLKGSKDTYTAHTIIISTGAAAKWLGLPSEEHYLGYGVSACATCDGPFFRDKAVAVIGGGNTAVEEALFLTNHASEVYLVHRRDTLRAEKVLQERLFKNPKIKVLWDHTLDEILGTEKPFRQVTGVRLKSTKTGSTQSIDLSGVFIAIGHKPNTGFLKGALSMDSEGYLIPQGSDTRTEISGVFGAGDVRDKVYRQAITSAGQGCMAALDAEKYLAELEAA